MRFLKFRSKSLNGYLNFDLDLRRQVTFLVGINGSGKTTVLKSIMALLGPDLPWLMNTVFESIELKIQLDGTEYTISCQSNTQGKLLSIKVGKNKPTTFLLTPARFSSFSHHQDEYSYDEQGDMVLVREEVYEFPDGIPVLGQIRSLPTPIFLGLDRTSLPTASSRNASKYRRARARRTHATMRAYLDESVIEAEAIATSAGRSARTKRASRAEQLREDILLTLFSEINTLERAPNFPKVRELQEFRETRDSIKNAFRVLGIPPTRANSAIETFFERLIRSSEKLSKYKTPAEAVQGNESDSLYSWLNIAPQLSIIKQIDHLITKFNEDDQFLFEKIRRYEAIINWFLSDSRKAIAFSEDGNLFVQTPNSDKADVLMLSSGERQLFVLITTLMFNDDNKQANILIIDEPELSLHIRWQEMFVEAIQSANPEVQILLATHSPSIISANVEFCEDLS